MSTRTISDFGFAVLLMFACLLLATATIILYSHNTAYKKLNRELTIKNDSIQSLNMELNSILNNSQQEYGPAD